MFENMVLGRIFGCKKGEMTGSGRKLQNDDHHNFYSSPNVVKMIESEKVIRRICSTHVREVPTKLWWENQKERDRYEDRCVGWRIILKLILK
jgi:hypothetical protein